MSISIENLSQVAKRTMCIMLKKKKENLSTAEYRERIFLQKGDRVKIYKDPVTKQDLEGEATLVKFEYSCGTGQRWKVRFEEKSDLQVVSRLTEPPFEIRKEETWTTRRSKFFTKKKSKIK